MRTVLLSVLLGCLAIHSVSALTVFSKISELQHCPDNLRIESEVSGDDQDLADVTIRFTPFEPDLYKGRVESRALLTISRSGETVFSGYLSANKKGDHVEFSFQLALDSFANAKLKVSSSLYEKDGMSTLGGGHIYEIKLAEFAPRS